MAKIIKATANLFTTPDRVENKVSKDSRNELAKEIGYQAIKALKDQIKNKITENAEYNNVRSNLSQIESELEMVVMSKDEYEELLAYKEMLVPKKEPDLTSSRLLIADITGDTMIVHESYKWTDDGFVKINESVKKQSDIDKEIEEYINKTNK